MIKNKLIVTNDTKFKILLIIIIVKTRTSTSLFQTLPLSLKIPAYLLNYKLIKSLLEGWNNEHVRLKRKKLNRCSELKKLSNCNVHKRHDNIVNRSIPKTTSKLKTRG